MTIHGGKVGAWEYRAIAPDAPTPEGWQRISPTLIKFTHWERVYA